MPSNPFSQNKFTPQTMPTRNSGVPIDNSFGDFGPTQASTSNTNPYDISTPAGQGNLSSDIGNYFAAQQKAEQDQNKQQIDAGSALANSVNNQSNLAANASKDAMQYTQPSNSVLPFARMALARALGDSGAPQDQTPSYLKGSQPQGGGSPYDSMWSGLKQTGDQYMSDDAIKNSMSQYQSQLLNVDPYANPLNMAAIYGNTPDIQAIQNNLGQVQKNSQARRGDYEKNANQALQQAITNSKDSGGFWSKLGGFAATVAPYALAAL